MPAPPPPPPQNQLFVPYQKREQIQPFPNSTDFHTKHIAMIHGLWPSWPSTILI